MIFEASVIFLFGSTYPYVLVDIGKVKNISLRFFTF